MKNNTVKLRFKGNCQLRRIISNPVYADIDFSLNLRRAGKVEGNNVGIEVVLKKLAVNIQQSFVSYKDVVNRLQLFSLLFKDGLDKRLKFCPLSQRKLYFLEKEANF